MTLEETSYVAQSLHGIEAEGSNEEEEEKKDEEDELQRNAEPDSTSTSGRLRASSPIAKQAAINAAFQELAKVKSDVSTGSNSNNNRAAPNNTNNRQRSVAVPAVTSATTTPTGKTRKSPKVADRFLSSIKQGGGGVTTVTSGSNPVKATKAVLASAPTAKPAPLLEISADPDTCDNVSVSLSTVTGDEYGGSPPNNYRRKVMSTYNNNNSGSNNNWQQQPQPTTPVATAGANATTPVDRNRVPAYTVAAASTALPAVVPSLDEAAIGKLVDARVQAKLAGLEARLDEKYQRMLQIAEERWSSQMAILEAQIQGTGL